MDLGLIRSSTGDLALGDMISPEPLANARHGQGKGEDRQRPGVSNHRKASLVLD